MNWQITGHKKQLEFLQTAVQNGRLPHGLLFAGPKGIGKHTIARALAKMLVCETNSACGDCGQCKTFTAGANPDFLEITGEDGIKIEQIRDLTYKLSLKSYSAKFKVAIIDNAERMTEEAANSLLKSLEEPTDHTVIVLISANPNRLPKTIVSRTQKITFGPLRANQSVARNLSEAETEEQTGINEYYDKVFSSSLPDRLVLGAEMADMETHQLHKLFEIWLTRLQGELSVNPTLQIVKKIKAVNEGSMMLNQNVNSKLLLANLMLHI
jgi:DNA polymerase III delta' subunit